MGDVHREVLWKRDADPVRSRHSKVVVLRIPMETKE